MYSAVPHSRARGLSALTYGSAAGPSLQDPARLAEIVAQMQPSNRRLDVTGAIVCNAGHIQQWIEGPEAAIAMLWDRIRLDPRHRVHWATPPAVVTARHFPGSPMKLATTIASLGRLDPGLVDDMVMLPDTPPSAEVSIWADRRHGQFGADGAAKAFCFLDPAYRATDSGLACARAAALADVLTGAAPVIARSHLDGILRPMGVHATAALVQAVLDHVQADWMAGLISAWQRQLAVAMLQSALRLRLDVMESPRTVGSALVSALPGTPDMCGVMLKVALLRRVGWSVRLLLPQSQDEILTVAHSLQPDVVVLAGSRLFPRPAELAMLTYLLPALTAPGAAPVVLGGKLAETDPQMLLRRGATAVCGALSWITTVAADLAPAPALKRQGRHRAHGPDLPRDHARSTFPDAAPPCPPRSVGPHTDS